MDLIGSLVTDDYVAHDLASPDLGQGVESLKQRVNPYRLAFPDLHLTIEEILAEGDKVVTRWSSTGIHKGEIYGIASTGKSVMSSDINISRFVNYKIVEEWTSWDTIGLMKQLGAVL